MSLTDCNGNRTCSAPVVEVETWEFRSSQYCKIFRIRYTLVDDCVRPIPDYAAPIWGRPEGSCTGILSARAAVIQDRVNAIVYERFIYIDDRTAPLSADVAIGAICDGNTVAASGALDADGSLNCVFGVNTSKPDLP